MRANCIVDLLSCDEDGGFEDISEGYAGKVLNGFLNGD